MGFCMCKNDACPSHEICYRFNREPHPFGQAYANFSPAEGELACDFFVRFENHAANIPLGGAE